MYDSECKNVYFLYNSIFSPPLSVSNQHSASLVNIQDYNISSRASSNRERKSELHIPLYALHICTSTTQFSCEELLTPIQSNRLSIFSKTQSQDPISACCSLILIASFSTFICHSVHLVGTMPCPWGSTARSKKLQKEDGQRQGQLHPTLSLTSVFGG